MRIIAAIDIIGGKCVRLTRGDFNLKTVYNDDPLEVAREIEDNGIKYLHVVDLDGARNRKISNLEVVEKIASGTGLSIDFGGGLRTAADVRTILNTGVKQVTGGSIAVRNRRIFLSWLEEFGPEKIILGADSSDRKIAHCAWTEQSDLDIIDFIKSYRAMGICYTICTDIAHDGMLQGPSSGLYSEILAATDVKLIASGGISSIEDLALLDQIGCEGAITGKAIYEGKLTLRELGQYAEKKDNTVS